jgi:hypothetical protein
LVLRQYHTRIIHIYTPNLYHARGYGLHLKMQQLAMVAYGQFQDHIKVLLSCVHFIIKIIFFKKARPCDFFLSLMFHIRWFENTNDQRWKWYILWPPYPILWSQRICAIGSKIRGFGNYTWRSCT